MPIDPAALDKRDGQLSRLLDYLPGIFREMPADTGGPSAPLPLGRFLMAFESILLGLPKTRHTEWADLQQQPGLEEIIGGAQELGSRIDLLDGIQRYFDPGPGLDNPPDQAKVTDHNRAPSEFLPWLAGWVAIALRDDWLPEHKREFIAKAVQLYRLRGTKDGVIQFVQTYTGDAPLEIYEEADEFQIGVHSTIGVDTVLGGGAPFFFRVKMTMSKDPSQFQHEVDMVTALIKLQKPAHTSFSLDVETVQFQIGVHSTIGLDTLLGADAP